MARTCAYIYPDGTHCTTKVSSRSDKRFCRKHRGRSVASITTGRFSKRLRLDIAAQIKAIEDPLADTTRQEAMLRWAMEQWIKKFEDGEIELEEFSRQMRDGVEGLSRAYHRRKQIELSALRVITPEQFYILCTRIGASIQTWVSDPKERQGLAQDIAGLLRGKVPVVSAVKYDHPRLPEEVSAVEIVQDAIAG